MANTNCLKGWECPECKQSDAFLVSAVVNILLMDDGSEPVEGADEYYDDETFCRCFDCDFEGKVRDFNEDPNPETTGGDTSG